MKLINTVSKISKILIISKISVISMFLAVMIILTTISAIPVSSAVSELKVGDKIGNVLNTDIKVYINDCQIPSYVVNNKMSVIMEDLDNYGFDVIFDSKNRTITAERNYAESFKPIKNIPDNTDKIGSVAFPYLYTDIKAFLYDDKIDSFAIAGRIVIYIDDLKRFGTLSWNDEKRELKLKLFESGNEKFIINPNIKGIDQQSEEIEKIMYNYSPTGTYIITNASQLTGIPVKDLISQWYEDHRLFTNLNTAVHESCHLCLYDVQEYEKTELGMQYANKNYELDENKNMIYTSKYIVDGSPVSVKFPKQKIVTAEATGNLPKNLRSFRWEFYVSEGNSQSANLDGVYGLLDEFHAYYYGCKTVIDCKNYIINYLDKYGFSEDIVLDYFDTMINATITFYEFKFWTFEYLAYLRENYPDEYKNITSNENYKKVFVYIHDNYEKMLETILPAIKKDILDKLKELNIRIEEDESIIWIGDSGRRKYTEEINSMKTQLSGNRYAGIMEDFKK